MRLLRFPAASINGVFQVKSKYSPLDSGIGVNDSDESRETSTDEKLALIFHLSGV